ncbi:MAG: hemerythrin domain-containing protein [Elusimicrobia bacterium]|nr:hemerythrin domain-containing protein [Elusimicrobiota bacterium]
MKITDRLSGDHKSFQKIIQQLESAIDAPPQARDPKQVIRLVELLKRHVALHAWFEDAYYYPAVRKEIARARHPEMTVEDMEALEKEHQAVDEQLDRLEKEANLRPLLGTWPLAFRSFCRYLSAHMRKEEEVLFPLSEKLMGAERLKTLAREVDAHRVQSPRSI